MSNRAHISVLIPTYNRAEYIAEAVDSVLAQTYGDYEIIVIDDGSTDDTQDILLPYRDRIKYIYQPNKGKSAALNRGFSEAPGDWIAFLDSDDRWLPDKLEWQVKAVEMFGNKCGVCFTNGSYFGDVFESVSIFEKAGKNFADQMGIVENPVSYVLEGARHGILIPTMLVKRSLMAQVNGFDEELLAAEDTDFIFQLALITKFSFVNLRLIDINRTAERGGLIDIYSRDVLGFTGLKKYMYEKWLSLIKSGDLQHKRIILRRMTENQHERLQWCILHGKTKDSIRALAEIAKLTTRHLMGMDVNEPLRN